MVGNKSNKGFSLLEVVISVAALSFISLFVLEMFIVSANLNNRAKDTDIALAEAITAIESFKALTDPEKIFATADGTFMSIQYYDKAWDILGSDLTDGARYCLKISANVCTDSSEDAGALYEVAAEVTDIIKDDNPRTLASLLTKKYFPNNHFETE